ncbi:MAG: IclR family transcriptional regulator, acetate operon repressor [Thermoleophilaceae bacterium]|jgi:DNA-binding IclR family transcriptional regulator|nr:IclR family transcriptional regulator, acetate operon repressor [Thermoleophilaceae bacterium]MEA2402454.1 IclR family transcriptional regulator, acetate operon repressor [Thermoleophilaceae bacterium]
MLWYRRFRMAETQHRPGPQLVQSVGRSLDLLEAVASEELGLVALAERTGLGPSTAYRLLATLSARGYVARSASTGHYRLGHRLVELASVAGRGSERISSAAQPHLQELRDATSETVNLSVPDGLAIVYVAQVESPRAVRMFTTIGRRVPLHACAAGKAILASSPQTLLDEVLGKGLTQLTRHTLATPDALAEDLELTRERGFATDREEYEEGVACVAAPIFGPGGEVVAAASVSGPATRMLEGNLEAIGDVVRAQALLVSAELGAVAEPARRA